jgi:hypothetical protein
LTTDPCNAEALHLPMRVIEFPAEVWKPQKTRISTVAIDSNRIAPDEYLASKFTCGVMNVISKFHRFHDLFTGLLFHLLEKLDRCIGECTWVS